MHYPLLRFPSMSTKLELATLKNSLLNLFCTPPTFLSHIPICLFKEPLYDHYCFKMHSAIKQILRLFCRLCKILILNFCFESYISLTQCLKYYVMVPKWFVYLMPTELPKSKFKKIIEHCALIKIGRNKILESFKN